MSKASILRQLSDEDLVAVQHLIRRDAMPDDKIAEVAESKIGNRKSKIHPMVIARYRQSPEYKRWLTAWENQDVELRKAIETQKQRFEFISNLVQGADKGGLETVSNGLMARLLTLATEMTDEDLMEAAAGRHGWVAKVIRVVQEQGKAERNKTGEKAIEVSQDKKLSPAERERRLKEIFGIQ